MGKAVGLLLLLAASADASGGGSRRRRRSPPKPTPHPGPGAGFPTWSAPQPDPKKPLGGYPKLRQLSKAEVLHGGKAPLPGSDAGPVGSYNHNVVSLPRAATPTSSLPARPRPSPCACPRGCRKTRLCLLATAPRTSTGSLSTLQLPEQF